MKLQPLLALSLLPLLWAIASVCGAVTLGEAPLAPTPAAHPTPIRPSDLEPIEGLCLTPDGLPFYLETGAGLGGEIVQHFVTQDGRLVMRTYRLRGNNLLVPDDQEPPPAYYLYAETASPLACPYP